MDIRSKAGYPQSKLTNFAPHRFVIDDVECASMEGFLQSLKCSSPDMQEHICSMVGLQAKRAGAKKNWQRRQILYWRGVQYDRHSDAYQELLDRAYETLASQCEGFRKALLASGDATIEHSIGKSNPSETILTRTEFCSRLTRLRERVKNGEWQRER